MVLIGYIGLIKKVKQITPFVNKYEEVSGGGYKRQLVKLKESSPGLYKNIETIRFSTATEDWGRLVKYYLYKNKDDSKDTNIADGNFTVSVNALTGNTLSIPKEEIRIEFNGLIHILEKHKEESTPIREPEEDHKGKIFNPITGKYSWF